MDKDMLIEQKMKELRERISDAKDIIRRNDSEIESLLIWRPTAKQSERISELDKGIDMANERLEVDNKLLDRLNPLLKRLEDAKENFKNYRDIFEYMELQHDIEAIQDEIIGIFRESEKDDIVNSNPESQFILEKIDQKIEKIKGTITGNEMTIARLDNRADILELYPNSSDEIEALYKEQDYLSECNKSLNGAIKELTELKEKYLLALETNRYNPQEVSKEDVKKLENELYHSINKTI